jgi:class 3 adenylate cyclase
LRRYARPVSSSRSGYEASAHVRTFLIADVRGYTRFTEVQGDEVAVRLAAKFADLVREGVEVRGGKLVEVRGDEALAVFESARQAIRAAMDLEHTFAEETATDRSSGDRDGRLSPHGGR